MSIKQQKTARSSLPVPSFVGLTSASEAASRAKRAYRKRDTKPELALRRALWAACLRYWKHAGDVPDNRDVVFGAARQSLARAT
jgi:G:T-mismatch repair DNA endonuclease (very short patch repair protein)